MCENWCCGERIPTSADGAARLFVQAQRPVAPSPGGAESAVADKTPAGDPLVSRTLTDF